MFKICVFIYQVYLCSSLLVNFYLDHITRFDLVIALLRYLKGSKWRIGKTSTW